LATDCNQEVKISVFLSGTLLTARENRRQRHATGDVDAAERGEGRHSIARVVFSGKRGELRQRYREGQEDQLGALGLVVNMIVLWNTIYMGAVLEQLRKVGYPVNKEDKAHLSPLTHEHINTQGRHSFMMPEAVVKGELRPLRNPADDPD
jgi:Tn3 transposase DDE domain